jgi:hypothetical protein
LAKSRYERSFKDRGVILLKLKDIHLGSTDAKNEVLGNKPNEIERFLKSYVTPPALYVQKFSNKEKYFIVGLKGTGKTALLRYISLILENDEDSTSKFILFKSEIDEDLRKDFARAARIQVVKENSEQFDGDDFETVWRWFIYRKIGEAIQFDGSQPFQQNADLMNFVALVNSEDLSEPEKTGFMQLIPKMKKGNIEISRSPKLGLEFEWDENGKAKVNFNDLVRKADLAFSKLQSEGSRLNLFFDELELNYSTSKQHQRDSRLVRDLIVSIEKLNGTCKVRGFNICLYAAVRSEVLGSVDALGKEINKPMADFGAEILWYQPRVQADLQPLLHIVEQRINNARQEHGLDCLSSENLWKDYFPKSINMQSPQAHILDSSWYRPRDIVRLLVSAQEQYPDAISFNQQTLDAVRKKYSTACWVEMTEELKVKYKANDIDGIKFIFYGFRSISSFNDLSTRAEKTAKDHDETAVLMKNFPLKTILKDLYRIGAIGNIEQTSNKDKIRYSFRGDDELLFDKRFIVHPALTAHLSMTIGRPK